MAEESQNKFPFSDLVKILMDEEGVKSTREARFILNTLGSIEKEDPRKGWVNTGEISLIGLIGSMGFWYAGIKSGRYVEYGEESIINTIPEVPTKEPVGINLFGWLNIAAMFGLAVLTSASLGIGYGLREEKVKLPEEYGETKEEFLQTYRVKKEEGEISYLY